MNIGWASSSDSCYCGARIETWTRALRQISRLFMLSNWLNSCVTSGIQSVARASFKHWRSSESSSSNLSTLNSTCMVAKRICSVTVKPTFCSSSVSGSVSYSYVFVLCRSFTHFSSSSESLKNIYSVLASWCQQIFTWSFVWVIILMQSK